MRRARRASISAASSTIGPRATLISHAEGFMAASAGRPSRPRVAALSGRVSTTKSARRSAAGSARVRYTRSTPGDRAAAPRDADHAHAERPAGARDARRRCRPGRPRTGSGPRSGMGSTGAQRRARWSARKRSMRWVTQRHQPSAYSAIHGPKMPATRVIATRARDLRHQELLDAGAHALDPAEARRGGEQRARGPPAVEDLGLRGAGDRGLGRERRGDRPVARGKPDQVRVGAGVRRLRVVHEDAAGHAPILERSWSSKEKSTGRSARPWARYHCQVCTSPAWSV